MANLPFAQKRRSSRLEFPCRVKITGVDRNGTPFSEETETVCISRYGASLKTNRNYALGQTITVQTLEHGHSGQFRVVWMSPRGARPINEIGIEWIDAHRFWGIEFPPEDWSQC